ncbi:FliM/FliN family flagellar motor switch protein [Hydrogenobacter sp. T-2]|uniref:flagellar motor switch protein FliM n=1 Tax=Pampinifervens diazotrophicum TaxID=1632018 RepID=UPI002B25EBE3|nr:FliM/FliN family flagellar motor switch protein [Hydrogenobacter sp. T-2]WPM31643.1 FliM/FliN family flagellar motor switch protein [Hydrogenobacter sp. T-2]
MADEFLSQEEINLLLKTLGKEEEKKAELEEERVRPLDLSLFEHISAGRIPGLELIFERWINGLRRGLTSLVVTIPSIFKDSLSLSRFGEFTAKLPVPCAIGLFNIEPLRGTCLLAIDPKLIYIVVSSVFGGSAKPYKIEGRDFTRIEMKLIQRFLNICYQELEIAWSTLMDVKINPVGIETNPALLTMYRAKEKFILLKLALVIEGNEGHIYLAIPESSIAPYKDMLKGPTDAKSKELDVIILKSFQKIPLKIEVVLGSTNMSFREILELKEGDLINLNKLLREALEVRVQGKSKTLAFLGQVGSKKAIKVYKHLEKED